MATARQTIDHDEIREWVERTGGRPAEVEGTGGMLRIDFGDPDDRLEPVDWDYFFDVFDRSGLGFIYDPEGRFNKFVQARRDQTGIGTTKPPEEQSAVGAQRGRPKGSTSRKKTATRKASSSNGRKKSSAGRKKASNGRKKSSIGRKKTAARKSSTSRKKATTRKSSSSKKSSPRKKRSGRKYSPLASEKIETAVREMEEGKLRSGRSGKKVTNRKQAIAIGLSEARQSGAKVPPVRKKSTGRRKKR